MGRSPDDVYGDMVSRDEVSWEYTPPLQQGLRDLLASRLEYSWPTVPHFSDELLFVLHPGDDDASLPVASVIPLRVHQHSFTSPVPPGASLATAQQMQPVLAVQNHQVQRPHSAPDHLLQPLNPLPPPPAVDRIVIRAIGPNAPYGALTFGRPPTHAHPPLRIQISIMEIHTYFPKWIVLPAVAMRVVHAGWGSVSLAKAQLKAMNNLNASDQNKARAPDSEAAR